MASSMSSRDRESLAKALSDMLEALDNGEEANIWFSDADSKASWEACDNESDRDSASSGIIEISPIELPNMPSETTSKVQNLSYAFDCVFGSHDAAAFIRREEEKLVEREIEQRMKAPSYPEGPTSKGPQSTSSTRGQQLQEAWQGFAR